MSSAALILHDDESTLTLVRDLLKAAGYETAAATTAYRLLAVDVAAPPRLILLGMTALDDRDVELVALLRRRWPDTWILALFPAALRERAAHALALGADACLPEPFYPGEILAIARRIAARAVAAPASAPVPAAPREEPVAAPRERFAPGAVEQVAAGIAHMIRNPLQVIELQFETAGAGGAVDIPGMREQIRRIEGVVEELVRCAGKRDLAMQPVNVADLVRKIFSNGKKKAPGPSVVVKTAEEKAEVLGAPELLTSAFETLRRRAERTTPPDGQIEVRVEIRPDGSRRFVEVFVTHGGPPLTDDRRLRMFDPFPDPDTIQDGTGLELASLAGIVRNHGGSTSALAAGKSGTTIVVRLPAREEAAQPATVKVGQ